MATVPRSRCAFTLIELLVFIAIIAGLAMMLLSGLNSGPRMRAPIARCMSNQRQVAIALTLFNSDHAGNYPWQLSVTNGGSMESIPSGHVFPHLRDLSVYIDPRPPLLCPMDTKRNEATNCSQVLDENVSYFLDVDTTTNNAASSVLTGDRDLGANGHAVKAGLVTLSTHLEMNWMRELHRRGGNLAFVDGHVQFVRTNELNAMLRESAAGTNRLCVP